MKYAVDIIGDNEIDLENFKNDVIRIAESLGLTFTKRNEYSWILSEKSDEGSSIVLIPMNEDDQKERPEPLIEGYKSVLLLLYFSDDELVLPYLRKLFEEHNDLIVANYENMPTFTNETILFYKKEDLDETKLDDIWDLLGRKPLES